MPMRPRPDDIYCSATDSDDEGGDAQEPYIDPWDLENYAYIRQRLGSSPESSNWRSFSPRRPTDADYADIQYVSRPPDKQRDSYGSQPEDEKEEDEDGPDMTDPTPKQSQVDATRVAAVRPNFTLSNYGHLKIDYSLNWNALHTYIRYHS